MDRRVRRRRKRRARVAELSLIVAAPAHDRALGEARAGVAVARGDLGRALDARDGHRCGAPLAPAVAELARGVVAPAAHRAVDEQGAAVARADRELRGAGRSRIGSGCPEICDAVARPAHRAAPLSRRTQLCDAPSAIAVIPRSGPRRRSASPRHR